MEKLDESDGPSIRSDRTFSVKRESWPNYASIGLEFLEDILMFLEWMKNRIKTIDLEKAKDINQLLSKLIPSVSELADKLELLPIEGAGDPNPDFFNTFRLLRKELNNDEAVNGKDLVKILNKKTFYCFSNMTLPQLYIFG